MKRREFLVRQTSYAYTSFTAPVIGGSFSLVTAKTDRISATDTVVTGFTYNPANKFVAATTTVDSAGGGLNLTTTLTHDAIGNVTVVNGPRTDIADITSYSYDAERRRTIATDALGKQTRTFYDADGDVVRVASQFGAQWQVSCSTYSFTKKQLEAIGPAVVATDNLCPAAGPTVPTTTFTYDTLDRPSTTTQSLTAAQGGNRVTRTNYFSDGQVASLERAVGSPVAQTYASYTYTPNGLPATLVDAKAQRTTYGYDGFDRLARLVYPSKANGAVASPCSPSFVVGDDCELTSFDANGNVVSIRRRDGQSIGFVYDNLNRAITRIVPTAAETVSYSFDLLGRPLSMRYLAGSVVDKDYDVVSVWDRAGRLASTTSAKNRTLSFGYDPSGNRTQIIYPDLPALTVSYDYDVLNRVSAIRENGATTGAGVLASYVYDDLGRRTRVTLGNGAVVNAAYNPDDTLATLGHDLQGATATNDISLGYSYNQALQITGRTILPTLYAWKGHYNVARPYTVNGQNQYLTSGVKPIGHDARGNLTTDGTWTFTYDVDNRLRNADRTGQLASFAYDPAGRLRNQKVGTTATNFLYDGDNLLAEMNGTYLLLRRYVHGPGLDEPVAWYEGRTALTNKRWFLADHQGSIVAVTNSTGAPITRYAYGPFGEPSITTGSTFMYTGQRVVNKVGLYYYKARFYSPYLGRFLQTDPIGTEDDNNLYAYTANDPINLTDSSGNCPSCVGAASSVLLGGAIRFFTGQPVFDARAIGFDAAAGAVGAGLVSKAVQISRLGGLGLTATQKIGATSSLARAPTEGLYVLRSGGQAYVGQSGNTAARSAVSAAERGLTQAPVVRIGVEGGKLSREVAEQNALNLLGGKGAPGVLNSVNPIGVARQSALSNPTLGITSGVYAPGSSLSTSLGVGSGFGALNAFGSTPANAGTFGPK